MADVHTQDDGVVAAAAASGRGDGGVLEEKTDVGVGGAQDKGASGVDEGNTAGAGVDVPEIKHQKSLQAPRASRLIEGDAEPELDDGDDDKEDPNRPLFDQLKLDMKLLKEKIEG